ncbi:MAG: hypothetical protein AAFX44_18065 [Pseudomonadota bacterium]
MRPFKQCIWVAMLGTLLCTEAPSNELALECGGFEDTGLTEALPLVRVTPAIFNKRPAGAAKGCIVVAFGLEKSKQFKSMLKGHNAKVVAHSDTATAEEIEAVEQVLSQWMFSVKTYSKTDEPVYYSLFVF